MLKNIEYKHNKIIVSLQVIPIICWIAIIATAISEKNIFALVLSGIMLGVSIGHFRREYKATIEQERKLRELREKLSEEVNSINENK